MADTPDPDALCSLGLADAEDGGVYLFLMRGSETVVRAYLGPREMAALYGGLAARIAEMTDDDDEDDEDEPEERRYDA